MHTVIICADFKKMYLLTSANLQANILERAVNLFGKHHLAILCWTNHVIHKNRNIVALVQKYTRVTTISFYNSRGKPRGM